MIRLAEICDLDRIMEIYEHGRSIMRKNGNVTQWVNGYPQRELILEDIQKNRCHVAVRDKEIVGVFCFFIGHEPTYDVIDGEWLGRGEYGVIHRIASAGKGVMAECVKWCGERCRDIRIDTHEDNKIMQSAILKNGFSRCGIIVIADGTPRIAYELIKER